MRQGERSDNIYVVVDSSKIARCAWCGTMESKNWRVSRYGLYCSHACSFAAGAPVLICTSVFFLALGFGIVMTVGWGAVGIFSCFLMLALPPLCCGLQGQSHRRSVPRNSMADEVSLHTALLATVATSVVCPRCDAELDLRSIGKDRVYACGYCGTTGTIAVIDKSKQRGSSGGQSD